MFVPRNQYQYGVQLNHRRTDNSNYKSGAKSINQSINIRLLRHDKTHANNVKRRNANNIQIIIYQQQCQIDEGNVKYVFLYSMRVRKLESDIVLHVQAAVESGHDVSGYSVVRRWMVVVVMDAICD